mmetsp:Transcript_44898/g.90547  ORF Transcript_44898/g.90547 Transcript_44898/m.90547 type:complete len:200 (-) Transcript_44898:778-1377(-)
MLASCARRQERMPRWRKTETRDAPQAAAHRDDPHSGSRGGDQQDLIEDEGGRPSPHGARHHPRNSYEKLASPAQSLGLLEESQAVAVDDLGGNANIRDLRQKHPYPLQVMLLGAEVQRSVAVSVLKCRVGTEVQQEFHHLVAPWLDATALWRPAQPSQGRVQGRLKPRLGCTGFSCGLGRERVLTPPAAFRAEQVVHDV